jgi:multimeric flavodoxin WrbA
MRILLVNGAPRRNGFTREFTALFRSGAEDAAATVDELDLAEMDLRPCQGCYGCWSPPSPGRCVQDDDMAGALERYLACEVIVLATPLYYYSFSARIKMFLERLLPTTKPEPDHGRRLGLGRNAMRFPDRGPRGSVLIAVGAHRGLANYRGVVETFALVSEGMDAIPVGTLLRPESYFLDFGASKPITMRRVRGAFEAAGRELAQNGRIAPVTEEEAALPLTRDEESFDARFDTYWTIGKEIEAHGSSRKAMRDAAAEDLRILVPELAACLDPGAAGALRAIVLFDLADRPDASWHLAIADGRCAAVAGRPQAANLSLRMSAATLVDVILQRVDARRAVADGSIRPSGDVSLLSRFDRLFPPPSV